jgi:hypothetical protein
MIWLQIAVSDDRSKRQGSEFYILDSQVSHDEATRNVLASGPRRKSPNSRENDPWHARTLYIRSNVVSAEDACK